CSGPPSSIGFVCAGRCDPARSWDERVAAGALIAPPSVLTAGAPLARIEALTAAAAGSSVHGASGSAQPRARAAVGVPSWPESGRWLSGRRLSTTLLAKRLS